MDHAEINPELVRSLLQDQHPDPAGLEIWQGAIGWDNELWRLGNGLAVRAALTRVSAHASEGALRGSGLPA